VKKLLCIVAVAAITASLFSGCGANDVAKTTTIGSASTAQQTGTENKKAVNMQIATWGNDAHKKMYEEMLEKYKQTHPNVSGEVLLIPFNDYQQKMAISLAASEAPDIAWLSDVMIPQFMETNQLTDISSVKDDKDYDFNDINASSFDLVKKDGKYYGVAFSTPPVMLYYNKTLFQEKGLQTPMELYKAGKWNYDEFLKDAKAMTNKEKGIYGIKLIPTDWKNWYINTVDLVWGFGGDVFSPDGKKFTFNSEAGEKALQMYMDMMYKDAVHPKPGDQITFESGKLGMYVNTLSYMSTAKTIKDFEWNISPLPDGPKSNATRTGFAAYTMFKTENDPKNAEKLELFKFLTNKENMGITAQYFVPSRKSVLESDSFKKLYPENVQENFDATVLERLASTKVAITPANFAKINPEIQVYYDMLYTQSISVKDALKKMEETVAPLMDIK
jgi:multiple sugar transport system substrate-binding protein